RRRAGSAGRLLPVPDQHVGRRGGHFPVLQGHNANSLRDRGAAQAIRRSRSCWRACGPANGARINQTVARVSGYFGVHSRARFCASAISSGLILPATASRLATATPRLTVSDGGNRAAARLSHMWALTLSSVTPSPLA